MTKRFSNKPIVLGISSCLLGKKVRYDRGHKRDAYINGVMGAFFDFIPVCPEMAIGLGTPREPIQLVGNHLQPRAVGTSTVNLDVTDALSVFGKKQAKELKDISGYIFKSKSPSCGMECVQVHSSKGAPKKNGVGIYARAFMETQPLLPVEEEGRLNDPVLRESFIERVFAYRRWQELCTAGLSVARLIEFHTAHKFLLMAHGQKNTRELEKVIVNAGKKNTNHSAHGYIALFMRTLQRPATKRCHANVLMHLMDYLKKQLSTTDRAELLDFIGAYRLGLIPLIVPVTLFKHYFAHYPDPYVAKQVYLYPHPRELMLRNHV